MKKILKAAVLAALTVSSGVYAAELCTTSNSNYQKLTDYSGCIERPVLFVHGIWSDMTDFGVAGDVGTDHVNSYSKGSATDYTESTKIESEGIPYLLANKFGLSSIAYSSGINQNGLEFYNSENDDDLIVDQSSQLYERLKQVLNDYYPNWKNDLNAKVDLIAHSQGGLVVRHMIHFNQDKPGYDNYPNENDLKNPINHINHIITIDSPHGGVVWGEVVDMFNIKPTLPTPLGILDPFDGSAEVNIIEPFLEMARDGLTESALQFDPDGDLLQSMKGNPVRPIDNENIPFTAMWGVSKGLFRTVVKDFFDDLRDDCQTIISVLDDVEDVEGANYYAAKQAVSEEEIAFFQELGEGLKKIGSDFKDFGGSLLEAGENIVEGVKYLGEKTEEGIEYVLIQLEDGTEYAIEKAKLAGEGSIENGCKSGVTVAENIMEPWIDDMEVYFDQTDMMIEWYSQTGLGVFDQANEAFKTVQFTGVAPHGNSSNWNNRVGVNYRGTEVLNAFLNPPKVWGDVGFNIVPTIITPLLLN